MCVESGRQEDDVGGEALKRGKRLGYQAKLKLPNEAERCEEARYEQGMKRWQMRKV